MINKTDLAGLNEFDGRSGQVLSIYLDIDQSNPANLNRGFELALRDQLRLIFESLTEETERHDFAANATRATDFISKYAPGARGLIVFSTSRGPMWAREINVRTKTDVRWGNAAFIQPLVEVLDEHQGYAVVLADKTRGRIYTVHLGRIEKHSEVHALSSSRHVKTTGQDHLFSQSRFQRKADEHTHTHLKRIAELLEDLLVAAPFERVVLAGSEEASRELFKIMPKWLGAKVIGLVVVSTNATDQELLAAAEGIAERGERQFEAELVGRLIEESGNRRRATTDTFEAIHAVNEKRVRWLMYAENTSVPGTRCHSCGALFGPDQTSCIYCNLSLDPIENILPAAASLSLASGASVEQLRGEAAEQLRSTGGLGAFLRY
jgi:peptide subunit release factor 1 (eRF1)